VTRRELAEAADTIRGKQLKELVDYTKRPSSARDAPRSASW
jgi:hypothetical protein